MSAGTALRDIGHGQLQLAMGAAGEFWSTNARRFIEALPSGALFTADDLHTVLGDPPRNGAPGMLVRRAAKDDLLVEIGYVASNRPERRAGVIKQWRKV